LDLNWDRQTKSRENGVVVEPSALFRALPKVRRNEPALGGIAPSLGRLTADWALGV